MISYKRLTLRTAIGIFLIIMAFGGGANALSSDDFNSSTLNESLWTKINPLDDATFIMIGNDTDNELLSITVPSGVSHDVWENGNFAPRIMQATDNMDFNIEVKFQSQLSQKYQMEGIIVEQDNGNFLRFDFYSDGLNTHILAVNFTATHPIIVVDTIIGPSPGAVPIFMRVRRVGDQWTYTYSTNGNNWIIGASFRKIMNVTSVGPFVGNTNYLVNPAPAFTGLIDYFSNTFSAMLSDTTPPTITIWNGNSQKFGQPGLPQRWVNILGNVNDESGISSLNYSLNNGPVVTLSIGPDYRLQSWGDFNIDINATNLQCGFNQVLIKASDTQGNSGNETVQINYSCGNVWPQEYNINWSTVNNISDAAQIVDGLWTKEINSIRPTVIGYDRLIAIGDMTWTDYEIITPITINSPLDPTLSFGGPNFGLITRWQGHYPWDPNYPSEWIGKQPNAAWYPLGGLGVYIWDPIRNKFILKIIGNRGDEIAMDTSGKQLEVGIPYSFKMRTETNGTKTLYSLKVWQQNLTEPSEWTLSGYGVAGELKQGSVTLGAHNANVSFGNITVRPLALAEAFPIISDISVEANVYNAMVRWITSKPASSKVSYGLSTAYQNGSVVDPAMVSSHALLLNGLTQGTTYHYMINSTDSGGNSTKTGDLNFTTRAIFPPGITTQPTDQKTFSGSVAIFNVVANGTAPLSYRWKKNGVDIPMATGPSYTTPIASLADNNTKFTVVVSSPYGSSVTSNEVTLIVNDALSVIWWNPAWRYRVPVTAGSTGFERYEKPAEVSVNFTLVLSGLGQTAAFDENSLRVVETDNTGIVLNDTVPFQFDKDPGYNAAGKASGTVVFIMNGTTQPNRIRHYHIYFDTAGGSFTPLQVTPLITLTDNVNDEGQSSYRIGSNSNTYYYQKATGGFSSLVDQSGNDWITYTTSVSGAQYRGIPNAIFPEGYFHPGTAACCTSSIVSQGPLKVRIRTVTNDGKWESLWDMYPQYATMTMVKADHNYWFLYEGTPGGSLDTNSDFMVRSDGTQTLLSQSWYNDLPNNEWVYFSDPNVGRSLFAAHHEDDTIQDQYWPYPAYGLTVFGFGRTDTPSAAGLLSAVPSHFTIGLMTGTGFTQNSKTIYSAYKDLAISKGTGERYNDALLPSIITQPTDQIVQEGQTATFSVIATGASPLIYQWQKNSVTIPGANMATYTTPAITSADNGAKFKVVVSNILGSVTSNEATLGVSAPSNNQLVLLDATFEHNTTVSQLPPLMAISGKSATFFNIPPNVPDDLYSPIDYAHGTLYQRLEVFNKPSTKTVWYQICIFQDEITTPKHACAQRNQLAFNSPGIYYQNQPLLSLYQAGNISWNRSLLIYMLDITDTNNTLIDDRPDYNKGVKWDGYPDMNLYYPMNVRYTAIIVPAGGGQPSWPSGLVPQVIWNAPAGTNVPIQTKITLNFSKPMDQASVQSSFSTVPATGGNFSWSGNNVTYTPVLNLSYNTTYNVTVGTGARDLEGNNLQSPYSWQFSTLSLSDSTIPIVSNPTVNHEIPDDTDNEPMWGETAQLNVTVIDDSGVASVTINLSGIGGLSAKPMTNTGGNIWSTTTNASAGTSQKIYNLTVNATDIFANSNTSVTIPLRVIKNGDITGNGVVNIGDALRCANNVSFPGNAAYTLTSPYVADVTGNSVINIGDCLRLANNVSFPGNPLYILK